MLAPRIVDPKIHATVFKAANDDRPLSHSEQTARRIDRWLDAEDDVRMTVAKSSRPGPIPEHLF